MTNLSLALHASRVGVIDRYSDPFPPDQADDHQIGITTQESGTNRKRRRERSEEDRHKVGVVLGEDVKEVQLDL
jgi:hypothetical protein